jgi:hypothetical protein
MSIEQPSVIGTATRDDSDLEIRMNSVRFHESEIAHP